MISVRKATKEDLPEVLDLVQELADFENEPAAVTAQLSDYEEAWEKGLIDVILAEDQGLIVGMALYYDTFSTWKGKMLYLEDFVVKASHRNKGIGQLIYRELFEEAKRRGSILVKWQVLDWNEGAIRFYERHGATIEKQWWNVKKYL